MLQLILLNPFFQTGGPTMGKMLRIFGIIGIVLGIIIMIPVVTIPSGLAVTINGIVLYAIGKIYDDVRTIKDKLNIP